MTANFLVKNSSSSKDHVSLLSVSIREERNESPRALKVVRGMLAIPAMGTTYPFLTIFPKNPQSLAVACRHASLGLPLHSLNHIGLGIHNCLNI